MGLARITYNDYVFTDRSNYTINEQYIYDDSGNTVIATKFSLEVRTIVTSESTYAPTPFDDPGYASGAEMHYMRQRLSKPGQTLKIEHDGFYTGPLEVNGSYSGVQDVAWGPKPTILSWNPIGHTISAEVVWQCEFQIPVCDGRTGSPAFSGVMSTNCATSYAINDRGYTTVRHSGYIEIAMTRTNGGKTVRDNVDYYRNKFTAYRPEGFKRETSWDISPDFRRATFNIVDTEIASPFAWPADVVDIQATHRVGWARSSGVSRIANTISASIELAPGIPKGRAWMIFSSLVAQRKLFAQSPLFIQAIDIAEEIYANKISFQIAYYLLTEAPALDAMFRQTGLFEDPNKSSSNGPQTTWKDWTDSTARLHPHQNGPSERGYANLTHDVTKWTLKDLCINAPTTVGVPVRKQPPAQMLPPGPFCNDLPPPECSWKEFDAVVRYCDGGDAEVSVTLSPNELKYGDFNPKKPDLNMPGTMNNVARFIEDRAGRQTLIWSGYAERVGYQIPKPGRMKLGGSFLRPIGKGYFMQKFLDVHFCQPLYAASWVQEYEVIAPLPTLDTKDANGGVK